MQSLVTMCCLTRPITANGATPGTTNLGDVVAPVMPSFFTMASGWLFIVFGVSMVVWWRYNIEVLNVYKQITGATCQCGFYLLQMTAQFLLCIMTNLTTKEPVPTTVL